MMRRNGTAILLFVAMAWTVAGTRAQSPRGHDWPQWQGPQRDNRCFEKGLLQSWPAKGPKLFWAVTGIGEGYSAPTVAQGRVFGLSYRGDREVVWALNAANGEELWTKPIAAANRQIEFNQGSRSSVTVDGEYLYALGVSGDLACLRAKDGALIWRCNLVSDYGGVIPKYKDSYGYAESPLVHEDWTVVTPGGVRNTMVALAKSTGKLVWRASVPETAYKGASRASFSSIVAGDFTGAVEFVQFLQGGLVGITERGELSWRWNKPSSDVVNCVTPLISRNTVFATSAYGKGCGLARIELSSRGNTVASEIYFNKNMKNGHGGVVLLEDTLYGGSDPGLLVCLDFRSGKTRWQERTPGLGAIIAADGVLYYRNEDGVMFLIQANPVNYNELGRFTPAHRSQHKAWSHPVIAHGKLYLRDQDALCVYDIRSK